MGRFSNACKAFWKTLRAQEAPAPAAVGAQPPEAEPSVDSAAGDAVYTLALLQREGRLIDFLQENIEPYSDAQVGAAVRKIHADCRKVLTDTFGIAPVKEEPDGAAVQIPPEFDPRRIRIVGSPAGEPPFQGVLKHHGWRATRIDLPQRHAKLDPMVICPAEVEVSAS